MKVLLDCSSLSVGGGIQAGLSVVYHAVDEHDCEVSLVCSPQVASQLPPDLISRLYFFSIIEKASVFGKFRQADYFSKLEKSISPDIVFTVFGPSYWRSEAVNVQGFALGKMLYHDSRKAYPSRIIRWREELSDAVKKVFLRRNADYFIAETDVVKSRLMRLLRLTSDRVYVVGNSYSPEFGRRCRELSERAIKREDARFKVFVPASFYHHKNLLIIPHAAAILNSIHQGLIEFVFTLDEASSGWSKIKNLADSNGVGHMISTVGSVPNQLIADHYLAANAVLCTSLVESSTAVFPEAFMAERPLMVSDKDFARQLCGDAALYFDPLDPKALATVVLKLAQDAELQHRLVLAGSQVLESVYPSPAHKWQLQLQVLRAVAAKGRAQSPIP